MDINEFLSALHEPSADHSDLLVFFEGFQRDPSHLGVFIMNMQCGMPLIGID